MNYEYRICDDAHQVPAAKVSVEFYSLLNKKIPKRGDNSPKTSICMGFYFLNVNEMLLQ